MHISKESRKTVSNISSLYERALPAKRTGPLYNAFPYPTKISPEAIALYIASHTNPGDMVFDGFAGSGTTGLAALLCENPSAQLRAEARRLGLKIKWGARNAVLYELGVLGSFISRTLTNPPNPKAFHNAANRLLYDAEHKYGWMYETNDGLGDKGIIRHAIWTDVLLCPVCHNQTPLWDSCVSLGPARIDSIFRCSHCTHETDIRKVERLNASTVDDMTGELSECRVRKIARIYGITGTKRWSRLVTESDLVQLERISQEPIPDSVPNVLIPWGDLYRRGSHKGISHLHHFYTRRNLIVFGSLWRLTEEYEDSLRDALRFWLLSYNAAHATLMSRVVAKSQQKDLVVTSAQPGVLYVSGLPVEKNLFIGLKRKLKTIINAFTTIYGRQGKVDVFNGSSCSVGLPNSSIDYVFTDPPFGGNIPYAELNFINEAWLGAYTDRKNEIIVSESQDKKVSDYQELLTKAFLELHRILKPEGRATVVFHSTAAHVWNAFQAAYNDAEFTVELAGVLDKLQGSFKQVTTAGAVRGDPIILLSKGSVTSQLLNECEWKVAQQLKKTAQQLDPSEQTPQRLYSRLINYYLERNQKVPINADEFYRWYKAQ